MSILGASNPAPGVGKGISYMGGNIYAGWSGEIIVNNSTVEMFNFTTPNRPLLVSNFQYYVKHSSGSPSANEYVGWILTIDGIETVANIVKATTSQHYNDLDQNSFVLPANASCKIESYTNTATNIRTFSVMICKQIGGNDA